MISSKTILAKCPLGYIERCGDILGSSSESLLPQKTTKDQCMVACNLKDSCLSFQHSPSEMRCNLNDLAWPIFDPYQDYIFCSKNGDIDYINLKSRISMIN